MEEQRKYPRIDVSFPIECNSLPQRNYFYTVSRDLSIGGVKILANEFTPKNDCMKVSINLVDKVVSLKAKVAWCNKDNTSDERYSTGLEFIEMNEDNKKILSQFLNTIYQS